MTKYYQNSTIVSQLFIIIVKNAVIDAPNMVFIILTLEHWPKN